MVGETTGGFGGFWPTGCLADILGKLLPQRLNFFARVVGQQEVLEVEGGDALLVKFEKNPLLFLGNPLKCFVCPELS